MAQSVFLGVIVSLENRAELQINTVRIATVKQYRSELLVACEKVEFTSFVEQFSSNLLTALQTVLCIPIPATVTKLKEQIWMNYVGARLVSSSQTHSPGWRLSIRDYKRPLRNALRGRD